MLKLKYLNENSYLAKEALKNWEHDNSLDEILTQFRISSNAIYPFFQNCKVCFLRLAPAEEKSENNILGEMEFINYLLECGFPALKLIQTITGEICIRLDTKWGSYYAAAFNRVDGIPMEDSILANAKQHFIRGYKETYHYTDAMEASRPLMNFFYSNSCSYNIRKTDRTAHLLRSP